MTANDPVWVDVDGDSLPPEDRQGCQECGRQFPTELISPFVTGGAGHKGLSSVLVCPLCALRLRNRLHGLAEDTPFTGEVAQQMYEDAQEYLRRNPHVVLRRRPGAHGEP